MASLCPFAKYRDFFGAAETGVHKYKFLKTSIVDYVLTLLLSFIITFATGLPLELVTIFVFTLGVILHILFGVPTHTNKFLGIQCALK